MSASPVSPAQTHRPASAEPAPSSPVHASVVAPSSLTRRRRTARELASDVGQGTVEYVGLLLLMATVLAGIVAAAQSLGGKDEIGKKVVTNIGQSIDRAGGSGGR